MQELVERIKSIKNLKSKEDLAKFIAEDIQRQKSIKIIEGYPVKKNSDDDRIWPINIKSVSLKAYRALQELDKSFVGTPHYMGLYWFWVGWGIKHTLRECRPHDLIKIHDALMMAGIPLDLDGDSDPRGRDYTTIVNLNISKKTRREMDMKFFGKTKG